MTTDLHLMDLDELIASLEARRERALEVCRERGATWTPVEEARWEGAFLCLMDLLGHELAPMRDQWRQGGWAYRKTEQAAAGDSSEVD